MACTCGSPGLPEFWNSTLAFCAATGLAPGIHCRYTSATSAARPSRVTTGLAHRPGNPARDTMAGDPVYRAQFSGLPSRPGWTAGLPLAPVRVAPPMMLLMARAATARLSTGVGGLWGWCRFSDPAIWPPWAGVIGSSPFLPVLASAYPGSLLLVSSANTQRIWLVSASQAKLTWPGSDTTFGFRQAVVIWLVTVA